MEDRLILAEKYEHLFDYMYGKIKKMPKENKVLRDELIKILIKGVSQLYNAVMANSKSRVNEFDSTLAVLRYFIRNMEKYKYLTPNQATNAEVLISEVGGIVNKWKQSLNNGRSV